MVNLRYLIIIPTVIDCLVLETVHFVHLLRQVRPWLHYPNDDFVITPFSTLLITNRTRYTATLEKNSFQNGIRGTADLCWVIAMGATVMLAFSYFWTGIFILGPSLLMMFLYIWSRQVRARRRYL